MSYNAFLVSIENNVAHLRLNRPDKANAMNEDFWKEIPLIFNELEENNEVRVIILSGEGKHFSSGIDLSMLMKMNQINEEETCKGRVGERLKKFVLGLQSAISSPEKCSKPVIAAISGACVGGGVDLATACDMRYATEEAVFCVKEVDLGIIADIGTLQRLPKIIGFGLANELALTARNVSAQEAEKMQLVNKVFANKEEMLAEVMKIAVLIAEKSPSAVRGTKNVLLHARDHSVSEGLEYVATLNASQLLSEDLKIAMMASFSKQKASFR